MSNEELEKIANKIRAGKATNKEKRDLVIALNHIFADLDRDLKSIASGAKKK